MVDVELDGERWRTIPADAVVRSALVVGRTLDRGTARALARELRRTKALGAAVTALRHRDLSSRRLAQRLEERGIGAAARADALAALERSGVIDDDRAAEGRARGLAGRGWGDEAIRFRLEQEGFAAEVIADAIVRLEPEADRARRLLARGRTAQWLAARGFELAPED